MGSVIAYSAIATLIIALLVKATIGLRVSEEEEFAGLDLSIHGEPIYASDHGTIIDLADNTADAADSKANA